MANKQLPYVRGVRLAQILMKIRKQICLWRCKLQAKIHYHSNSHNQDQNVRFVQTLKRFRLTSLYFTHSKAKLWGRNSGIYIYTYYIYIYNIYSLNSLFIHKSLLGKGISHLLFSIKYIPGQFPCFSVEEERCTLFITKSQSIKGNYSVDTRSPARALR